MFRLLGFYLWEFILVWKRSKSFLLGNIYGINNKAKQNEIFILNITQIKPGSMKNKKIKTNTTFSSISEFF